jgi:hypothetical protein
MVTDLAAADPLSVTKEKCKPFLIDEGIDRIAGLCLGQLERLSFLPPPAVPGMRKRWVWPGSGKQ